MVKLSRTTFSFFRRFAFCSAVTLSGFVSTDLAGFTRGVFGAAAFGLAGLAVLAALAALAGTAGFSGAAAGATAGLVLPFARLDAGVAFLLGFLVLGAAMVISG
ncbi:hypothetical protein [Paraburkholderia sp. GAS33]|uniref:hypothetical protein n=1 Tax=Paraburkholderia sp. GAS33 TaxID=3035130 RepID=UPI003D246860